MGQLLEGLYVFVGAALVVFAVLTWRGWAAPRHRRDLGWVRVVLPHRSSGAFGVAGVLLIGAAVAQGAGAGLLGFLLFLAYIVALIMGTATAEASGAATAPDGEGSSARG